MKHLGVKNADESHGVKNRKKSHPTKQTQVIKSQNGAEIFSPVFRTSGLEHIYGLMVVHHGPTFGNKKTLLGCPRKLVNG